MRKLLFPVLALSMIAAAPATSSMNQTSSDEGGDAPVSEACLAQTGLDFILTTDGLQEVIATPSLPSPYPLGLGGEPDPLGMQDAGTDVYTVLVDVSPHHTSASADVAISWEHTGDLDMDLYADGVLVGESHAFNPLDGNAEAATAGRIGHCQTFDIHVRNYVSEPGDVAVEMTLQSLFPF